MKEDWKAADPAGLNGDFFHKIVREMDDGIVAVDASGNIVFCNRSAEQLFQVGRDELNGKPLETILPHRFRDDHAHHLRAFQEGDADARYMGSRKSHVVGLRADGSEVNLGATILRTTGECGPVFIAVVRDLTERLGYQSELERLANTDPLSGLYNRRAFTNLATQELQRCRQARAPVCLFLFDLDHFKQINDNYGHDVGDKVICEFAEFLKPVFQSGDILGRWGGEEFIALMPNTSAQRATTIAEIIRRNIEILRFVGKLGHDLPLTTSVGITCDLRSEASLDDLIKQADRALYAAKSSGRNRVTSLTLDNGRAASAGIQGAA